MSKQTKKPDLPILPQKYFNEKKIEESDKRLLEDKQRLEKLLCDNQKLQMELKQREQDAAKTIIAYNLKFEDQQNQLKNFEKQNNQYKADIETIREETANFYQNEINILKDDYEKRLHLLQLDLSAEKERTEEYRNKKNEYKQEAEELRKERDNLNDSFLSTVNNYKDEIRKLRADYESKIEIMKLKEEEYLKHKEILMENEIYDVYKNLKKTFDMNLSELKEFKELNNKINDENKIFKLSIETSDNILKECAKVQIQKQKIINQQRDTIDQLNIQLTTIKERNDILLKDLSDQYNLINQDLNKEIGILKNKMNLYIKENKRLKQLSQIILDQRNEVEVYFLESLEEIKMELYKKKKNDQKKKSLFPSLNRKYENTGEIVSIKDLTLEDKERLLKILFSKINENAVCKSYRDFSLKVNENDNNNDNE